MFTAKGVRFVRLPSGLCQATVSYLDDSNEQEVFKADYVVANQDALKQKVAAQLYMLKDAAESEHVTFAMVDQVLGTI